MRAPDVETVQDPSAGADNAFASPARARQWLARIGLARPPQEIRPPPLGQATMESPRRRPSAYLVSFVALVVLPAIAAALYFTFIAADQYVAETRFAVHSLTVDTVSDQSKSKSASTSSSVMSGLKAATDDSYLVAAYVRSRACIDEVGKTLNLREMFRRPEADVWARLKADASPEELTKYWNYMVTSYVDPPSGIVTVTVAAFRREDALAISNAVLAAAEKVANDVSTRARDDVMKAADKEVIDAQERVVASLSALRAFREQAGFIDPKLTAQSVAQELEELTAKRIRLETEYLVSSRAMSPEAPTLQSMKSRLDQLDIEIATEKAKLTSQSSDPSSLANLLPKYEELFVRNAFAEKLYGFAADGLERARLRAAAQTIYVEVFVPAALPQDALYPERFAASALIALALLILWGIVALTAALVEDHKI